MFKIRQQMEEKQRQASNMTLQSVDDTSLDSKELRVKSVLKYIGKCWEVFFPKTSEHVILFFF